MLFQSGVIRHWIQRGEVTQEEAQQIADSLGKKALVKSQEKGESLEIQIIHAFNEMRSQFSESPPPVKTNAVPLEMFERCVQVARDYESQKIKSSLMSQIFTLLGLKVSQGFFSVFGKTDQDSYFNNVLQAQKLGKTEQMLFLISHQEVLDFTFLASYHRQKDRDNLINFLYRFPDHETEQHVSFIQSQIEKESYLLSLLNFVNHERQENLDVFYFSSIEKCFFLYEFRDVSYLVPLRK